MQTVIPTGNSIGCPFPLDATPWATAYSPTDGNDRRLLRLATVDPIGLTITATLPALPRAIHRPMGEVIRASVIDVLGIEVPQSVCSTLLSSPQVAFHIPKPNGVAQSQDRPFHWTLALCACRLHLNLCAPIHLDPPHTMHSERLYLR